MTTTDITNTASAGTDSIATLGAVRRTQRECMPPDGSPAAPRRLPTSVRDLSAEAVSTRSEDPAWANRALTHLAEQDLAAACLLWRNLTNITRLKGGEHWPGIRERIRDGYLVATNFTAARTKLQPTGDGGYRLTASRLMTTGAGFASDLLLEATLPDGTIRLVLAPSTAVTAFHRPPLLGLHGADNALLDLDADLPPDLVLDQDPAAVVERPYALGLTMGAVTLGGCRQLLALSGQRDLSDDQRRERGHHVAAVLSLEALVTASAAHGPSAGAYSRAAKIHGTRTAESLTAWTRHTLGAPGYSQSHPLVDLTHDLQGLTHQAPTDDGAALHLGTFPRIAAGAAVAGGASGGGCA